MENENMTTDTNVDESKANAETTENVDKATNDAPNKKHISYEEYQQLKSTNERLLDECKKHKAQKEKAQKEALDKEQDKDKLIQHYKSKVQTYEEREKQDAITAAIAVEAKKRGCDNWDFLYNSLDSSEIIYNEETGQVEGVTDFFDKAQQDERVVNVFFAKHEKVETENTTPSNPTVIDYKKDPVGALRKERKEKGHEAAEKLRIRMQKEGLISF